MTILTDTFIPYEYDNKRDVLNFVISRCQGLQKSLRLVEKDNEHLLVRCPLSGDYLGILGTPQELEWVDTELRKRNWYRN